MAPEAPASLQSEVLCWKACEPTETAVLPPSSSIQPPSRARSSVPLPPGLSSVPWHMPPRLGLPTILPSKLPSPTLRVPASLPVTRSKARPPWDQLPVTRRKEPCALAAPFTCPLKTHGARWALACPWVKPPPWPPLGLPATCQSPGGSHLPPKGQRPTHLVQLAARPLTPSCCVPVAQHLSPSSPPGISQRNTFYRRIMRGGRASWGLWSRGLPGDSGRAPMENPPVQVPPEASPGFLPLHPLERGHSSAQTPADKPLSVPSAPSSAALELGRLASRNALSQNEAGMHAPWTSEQRGLRPPQSGYSRSSHPQVSLPKTRKLLAPFATPTAPFSRPQAFPLGLCQDVSP